MKTVVDRVEVNAKSLKLKKEEVMRRMSCLSTGPKGICGRLRYVRHKRNRAKTTEHTENLMVRVAMPAMRYICV